MKHRIANEDLTAVDRYMAYRLHQVLTTVCRRNLVSKFFINKF